jgi:hypothetical protein
MLGAVFQRDENMVTIEVIEGYSYDIQKVDFSNDLIDAIFSYAQREDIPLVFNICRFLSEPKEANFLALQAVISSLENSYRSFVLVNLRLVNSFFWSVYSNQGLLRGDWRDILMEIQGIETHLSLRKYDPDFILKIKRHSRHSSFSKENKFAMIEAFWRKYLHSAGSSIAYISYFKLIDVILSDLTKEEVEFLRSDREFSESIKRSISLCFENNDIQFHQMPMVLYFLDVNEVFELIKKYGYPKSRVRILHREIVLWEYGQFTFSKTFHTAVELIEMQLMAKSAPSYCILVQQCFLGFSLFEEIDYSILPARAIERSIVSDDEEQYKAIILILNANMNDSSCLQVESILLNNSILLSDEYYILLILRVLRFYVPVKYVERLLLFLSRNVRLVDRSELDTQIRDFIGSRPSGVEIEVMLD